jgi:hypothetical protein
MRKLLVVVLAATLLPATLQAQSSCTGVVSCTVMTEVQVVVPGIVSLDLGAGNETLDLSPTAADLGDYVVKNLNITVKANVGWQVSVKANSPNWTHTGDGVKPASDLSWSTTAGVNYHNMTTDPVPVMTGGRTTAPNSEPVPMSFRVWYPEDPGDPANAAGTYALGVTFTITAQ